MTRRAIFVAAVLFAFAAAVIAFFTLRSGSPPRSASAPRTSTPLAARGTIDAAALARLHEIPFYRGLGEANGLRSCTKDADGALRVSIDLRALAGPRLASAGFAAAAELLPPAAAGTIVVARDVVSESWQIAGPAPLLDVLDRTPQGRGTSTAEQSIPGNPAAIARMHIVPSCLVDPSFGGPALATWRDRAAFAENLFGRPWRSELAEDLAGPAVLALYDAADGTEADALVALELRRSDRASGLLETLFGLGALTEHATIARYRGVATGSFDPASGGPGAAAAVDGLVLLVATSRSRLESAIDARRGDPARTRASLPAENSGASWAAESNSAFVAHGWWKLARCPGDPAPRRVPMKATLRPEGQSGWLLEGRGLAPALTADPLVPLLRSAVPRRQRAGD